MKHKEKGTKHTTLWDPSVNEVRNPPLHYMGSFEKKRSIFSKLLLLLIINYKYDNDLVRISLEGEYLP